MVDNTGVTSSQSGDTSAPVDSGDTGGDTVSFDTLGDFGQADSEPTNDAPEDAEGIEAAAQPEVKAEPILGKFQTQEDLIKAYSELEKTFHSRSQEMAEQKKQFELAAQAFQQAQQAQSPEQQDQRSPYFHEWHPDQQKEWKANFMNRLSTDPANALFDVVSNLPYFIDQQVMNSPKIQEAIARASTESVMSNHQMRQSVSNHVEQFAQQHPRMQEPEVQKQVGGMMEYLLTTGQMNMMMQQGIDPLDFAYNYTIGKMAPQDVAKIQEAEAQKAQVNAQIRNQGFQLGAGGAAQKQPAGPQKVDLFGLGKK